MNNCLHLTTVSCNKAHILACDVLALLADIERKDEALREIAQGSGPFSRDRLTHAENTIESMKELARAALAPLPEGGAK